MNKFAENIKAILAAFVVAATYSIFFVVLFRYANDNNAVSQVIIAVVGALGVVTGYYFGYSQGSSKKDDTLATLANNQQPTVQNADTVNVKK